MTAGSKDYYNPDVQLAVTLTKLGLLVDKMGDNVTEVGEVVTKLSESVDKLVEIAAYTANMQKATASASISGTRASGSKLKLFSSRATRVDVKVINSGDAGDIHLGFSGDVSSTNYFIKLLPGKDTTITNFAGEIWMWPSGDVAYAAWETYF